MAKQPRTTVHESHGFLLSRSGPGVDAATRVARRTLTGIRRAEERFHADVHRLQDAVGTVLRAHVEGRTRDARRAARRMLDLEYALLGDCERTARLADAVGLPDEDAHGCGGPRRLRCQRDDAGDEGDGP